MGTTVTSNLGLIKPDDDEFIKAKLPTFPGWADQNADNCDTIDNLFRNNSSGTYSIAFNASSGGFTLGSGGFTEGKFCRIGPKVVAVFFRVFCGGSGFAAGTGFYVFNLPTTLSSEISLFANESVVFGRGIFQDNSAAATSNTFAVGWSVARTAAFLRPGAGNAWFNNTPVTLAQNDRFSGYMIYPTSDA